MNRKIFLSSVTLFLIHIPILKCENVIFETTKNDDKINLLCSVENFNLSEYSLSGYNVMYYHDENVIGGYKVPYGM